MKYILKRKNKPDKHFNTKLEVEQYIYSALVQGDYEIIEPQSLTNHSQSLASDLNAEPDMVNHPPHYANKDPETIQMIRAVLTKDEFVGYCKGQILKYRDRAHDKGNFKQDMAKAKFYYDLLEEVQE